MHGNQFVLSYSVGATKVLESPGSEEAESIGALTRTLNLGPRAKDLILQVARGIPGQTKFLMDLDRSPVAREGIALLRNPSGQPRTGQAGNRSPEVHTTAVAVVGGGGNLKWLTTPDGDLRLRIASGEDPVRLKLLYSQMADESAVQPFVDLLRVTTAPHDLNAWTRGEPELWKETTTTRV